MDAVYAVVQGLVEIVHSEAPHVRIPSTRGKLPAPASRSEMASFVTRSRDPVAALRPHVEVRHALKAAHGLSQGQVPRTVGTLQVGGIFGSLSLVDVEPFS